LKINLLDYKEKLAITQTNGAIAVWDVVRKKDVILTPEELVRQLVVHWLNDRYSISFSTMSLEKRLKIGEGYKRFDLVCFTSEMKPKILVECKAFDVAITDKVALQIAEYNQELECPYLILSNGKETLIYFIEGQDIILVDEMIV
jgi:hypothetical protein